MSETTTSSSVPPHINTHRPSLKAPDVDVGILSSSALSGCCHREYNGLNVYL